MISTLPALGLSAVLILSCLAPRATAQATTVPKCALGCARQAAIQVGCAITDTPCLCKTTFASSVLQCVRTTSCSAEEQTEVGNILVGMCAGSDSASAPSAISSAPSSTQSANASTTTATTPFSGSGSASSTTILTSVSASPPISTTLNSASPSPTRLSHRHPRHHLLRALLVPA
ncbi:hypothetical protein B0H11DRAFT_976779 [Mycena galericulata]|nr:hypothetical protein B0H11DRAFT_976779 [Mycena galericulata]